MKNLAFVIFWLIILALLITVPFYLKWYWAILLDLFILYLATEAVLSIDMHEFLNNRKK